MGQPKLILAIGGRTVIARVVSALRDGGAGRVVVVPPPPDAAGAAILHREAAEAGAEVVVPPSQPLDMRASFEHGLDRLADLDPPPSVVLLTPADSPGLTAALVARVVAACEAAPGSIVIPTVAGRRGHPVALPWALAQEVRGLPEGVGINALVALMGSRVVELPVDDPGAVADLDTPEDYQRWAGAEDG
jgi:CTP:molybdopterin cytidylyltransferase MocA